MKMQRGFVGLAWIAIVSIFGSGCGANYDPGNVDADASRYAAKAECIDGCGGGGGGGIDPAPTPTPAPESTPPPVGGFFVDWSDPVQGEGEVNPSQDVHIHFSEAIDRNSLAANLSIFREGFEWADISNEFVISLDEGDQRLDLIHLTYFEDCQGYLVDLGYMLQSVSGAHLGTGSYLEFRIECPIPDLPTP